MLGRIWARFTVYGEPTGLLITQWHVDSGPADAFFNFIFGGCDAKEILF